MRTFHDDCHAINKTMDDLQSMRSRCQTLLIRESVEPAQHCLDIVIAE
jgi:hypothetical protein